MRLVALALLAGCWSARSPQPAAPPAPAPVESPHATAVARSAWVEVREQLPAHSEWTGRYTCTQGLTGVTLVIDMTPEGDATVIFGFGPISENPNLPTGSYELRGRAELQPDRRFELRVTPHHWIQQPPGYSMVPLTLTSDRAHRMLSGKIEHGNCGTIEVKRS
jgi:hypothetical protein